MINQHQQIIEKQNSQMPEAMRAVMNPQAHPFKVAGATVKLELVGERRKVWHIISNSRDRRVIVDFDIEQGRYDYRLFLNGGETASVYSAGESKTPTGVNNFCKKVLGA